MYDLQKLKKKDFPDLRSFNGRSLPKLLPLIHINDVEINNPKFIFAKKNNLHLFWMYLTKERLDQWAQESILDGTFSDKISWLDINDFIDYINILEHEIDELNKLYNYNLNDSRYPAYQIRSMSNVMFKDFFTKYMNNINYSSKNIKILDSFDLTYQWFNSTDDKNKQSFINNHFACGNYYFNRIVKNYRFSLSFDFESELITSYTLHDICQLVPSYNPSDSIIKYDRLSNALNYLKKEPVKFISEYSIDEIKKIKNFLETMTMLGKKPHDISREDIVNLLSKEFEISGSIDLE